VDKRIQVEQAREEVEKRVRHFKALEEEGWPAVQTGAIASVAGTSKSRGS